MASTCPRSMEKPTPLSTSVSPKPFLIFFTSRIGILSTPEIVQFLFQLHKQHRQDAVEHQIERRGVEQTPTLTIS